MKIKELKKLLEACEPEQEVVTFARDQTWSINEIKVQGNTVVLRW